MHPGKDKPYDINIPTAKKSATVFMEGSKMLESRRLGAQRDWIWRGWQVRYTYLRGGKSRSPMLFLHGFGSALNQWQENLLPLSQSRAVYALDLVGFGGSEKAIAPYKVSFWVEQVYEFWQTFVGEPIVLVGHSLGALVALTAAIAHPDMVQRLVLVTLPAARQELLPRLPGWVQSVANEMEGMFASPLLIQPLFKVIARPKVIGAILRAVYVNPERVTEDLVETFLAPGRDRGAARTLSLLTKARTQNDFSPLTKVLLPQVQVPILVLWGSEDRVIPLTWGRQLPSLNPRLKLVEIAGGGHCVYDECGDRVNGEILAWLATH
jgi:pimeloyl-ACP methyl ester carboxylesterase